MIPTGPFDQDTSDLVTEPKKPVPEKLLSEKDFIQNNQAGSLFPAWLWIFLLSLLIISVIGTWNWSQNYFRDQKNEKPFLDVTNRQFSVFLWQFPSYLRMNSPIKTGYLPGFETNGESVQLSAVENFVSAPPDLLFLYHTWNRLLETDYIPRPIAAQPFDEFLNQTQEWLPLYWKNAPKAFVDMLEKGTYKEMADLQTLTMEELPLVVRQSFQGWKNYFEEGPEINALAPTFKELEEFLDAHPHYKRNYWRNIQTIAKQQVAGNNYLLTTLYSIEQADEKVPSAQLAPFLKVALFNAQQAKLGK